VESWQPRVLFYVQHLLGIGHLMRSVRICEALSDVNVHVTLVTGGMPVSGFPPAGIEHVELPPIAVRDGDFSSIVDSNDQQIDDDFKAKRGARLLEIYRNVAPELVVLEAFPFGRRQLRFELLPLIDAIAATKPKPILVSSIRDFLQRRTKPGRDDYVVQLISQFFDKIVVHGDPTFARLTDSFPKASQIEEKIVYSGLVCAKPTTDKTEAYDVVVSAGGGAVGVDLVKTSIDAARLLPKSLTWCIVTGPNSPINDQLASIRLASPNITFEEFRSDFPSLLRSAQLSVSQAGYNTVSDILKAECRCLLVPYSSSGETEQLDRATRLVDMGLANMLSSEGLTGKKLASRISSSLLQAAPAQMGSSLNTDGSSETARILLKLIEEKRRE
ncbi:MAG: putative glycosyltransferase, partial [Patiriisocius sp.]